MHKLHPTSHRTLPLFPCLMSTGSSASFLPSPLQESALVAAGVISILQLAARSASSPSLWGLGLDPGQAARWLYFPTTNHGFGDKIWRNTGDLRRFLTCCHSCLGICASMWPHPELKPKPVAMGRAGARCLFLIKLGSRREPRSSSPAPDDNGRDAATGRTSR